MAAAGDIYKSFVEQFPTPVNGSLRLWWIPQIPGEAFHWPVKSVEEALMLHDVLAAYDDFQFAENVKPDYSNMGGLEVFEYGEWIDWRDANDNDFDDVRLGRAA